MVIEKKLAISFFFVSIMIEAFVAGDSSKQLEERPDVNIQQEQVPAKQKPKPELVRVDARDETEAELQQRLDKEWGNHLVILCQQFRKDLEDLKKEEQEVIKALQAVKNHD